MAQKKKPRTGGERGFGSFGGTVMGGSPSQALSRGSNIGNNPTDALSRPSHPFPAFFKHYQSVGRGFSWNA
jgi:hypothetical protein